VASVVVNIFINMQREPEQDDALSDGSSFSDRDNGVGPADDLLPQGRVYSYSSDEDEPSSTIPLPQRIKRSRFVSRIQEERIQFESSTNQKLDIVQLNSTNQKLDLEQFQPMMTSEKAEKYKIPAPPIKTRIRRNRGKRECNTDDYYDETTRYLRKRERKESDYGSLSTLDSSMLKLDIIEPETKVLETKLRDNNRGSSKLLTDCQTFRRTMTQLRKQTLNLVKDIDDAKKRVEESYAETEKLKAEYDRMSQETEDMITHLKFARSKIKTVMKWKK